MNQKRTLVVGADPFPPYQYVDGQGKLHGSDYETVMAVLREAGVEAQVILKEWAEVEAMLDSGKLDAAFQVQKTPEREKRWFFSSLLRNAVTEVITSRASLRLASLADAAGQGYSIGVITGYSYGDIVDSLPPSAKKTYESQGELLAGVAKDEVHLAVFDQGVRRHLAEEMGLNNIYSVPGLDFLRPLYVVFTDAALRDAFNGAFSRIQAK